MIEYFTGQYQQQHYQYMVMQISVVNLSEEWTRRAGGLW